MNKGIGIIGTMYISMSYFHTCFYTLRRRLKKLSVLYFFFKVSVNLQERIIVTWQNNCLQLCICLLSFPWPHTQFVYICTWYQAKNKLSECKCSSVYYNVHGNQFQKAVYIC